MNHLAVIQTMIAPTSGSLGLVMREEPGAGAKARPAARRLGITSPDLAPLS